VSGLPANSLQSVIVAIAIAYAQLGALLLILLMFARLDWRIKAAAITLTSAFYIVSFFASRSLLGWASPEKLPRYFKLLQTRVVEPNSSEQEPGSIYLWVEALGEDNRPVSAPRAYRLPYTVRVADQAEKATAEIAAGHPQGGLSANYGNGEGGTAEPVAPGQIAPIDMSEGDPSSGGGATTPGAGAEAGVVFTPLLPPKMPAKDQ
jgi:hypothetical protein